MSALPTDSTKVFSNHLNRQVAHYSLAAAVAGVSLLALAQPAAGEVVNTKKTIPIPPAPLGTHPVYVSMANNGINNFSFDLENLFSGSGRTDRNLEVRGFSKRDGVQGTYFSNGNASALPRGAKIGPAVTNYFFLITDCSEQRKFRFSGPRRT
jgi:hypothetical protein